MARREHPRYENTEWPDYEFMEYPMMVYPGSNDGGKTPDPHPTRPGKFLQEGVIVKDEQERRDVLQIADPVEQEAPRARKTQLVPTATKGVSRVKTEDDERAELLQEAETLGVQIDKSWSLARLQDAIDTHKQEAVV